MKTLQEIKDEYAVFRHGYKDWESYLMFNDWRITNEDLYCIAKLYAEELWDLINR